MSHRIKPNAFASIRINSSTVRKNIEKVQQEMVRRDPRLEPLMVSLDKLHLTLMVMKLDIIREEERAGQILCEVTKKIIKDFSMDVDPMDLELSGIGHFSNKVVFAKIAEGDAKKKLENIAVEVRKAYAQSGFPSTLSPFSAHLTIAKLPKYAKIDSIPPSSYADLSNTSFGMDRVSGLELLSMTKPEDAQSYYYCFQKCPF